MSKFSKTVAFTGLVLLAQSAFVAEAIAQKPLTDKEIDKTNNRFEVSCFLPSGAQVSKVRAAAFKFDGDILATRYTKDRKSYVVLAATPGTICVSVVSEGLSEK